MSGQKINIGALYDYNKDGFKFIQSINLYAGQAKKNLINIPSTEKYKYTKLTSSSALRLHLYKNFKLDFTLNTQYSKAILPMIERFSAGRGLEGQGFQNSQIGGDCGVAGAIVLSRTYLINHVLLRGVSGYSYVNSSIAYERSDTAYTKGTAVGAGVRLFLANDLRVKLELNKPLYQKLSSKTANADKSFRVFLGLTYNFSF
jgi:hemolysin activation/secretion protein